MEKQRKQYHLRTR